MFIRIDLEKKKVVGRPVNGIKPSGFYLPVIDNSSYPDAPDAFKAQPSYTYIINVETWLDEAEIKADWSFSDNDYVEQVATQDILPLEQCRSVVYQQQKLKRQYMQLGEFDFNGTAIYIKDREDSLIISALAEEETNFKVSEGKWILLTPQDVIDLKSAHRAHVQPAYDWEKQENDKIAAMNYEELVEYIAN